MNLATKCRIARNKGCDRNVDVAKDVGEFRKVLITKGDCVRQVRHGRFSDLGCDAVGQGEQGEGEQIESGKKHVSTHGRWYPIEVGAKLSAR